jgi:hypothetical protein
MSSRPRAFQHLSAPVYFACVALVTGLGVAGTMAIRPAFAHRVLELAGLEAMPRATPGSFYALRVAPLFAERCISCHGENRQKAELRLDSYAFAMRGSRRGAVIIPGNPKASELMTRIALPPGDDRAMPPEGKTPFSPDEVTVVRLWIAAGASPTVHPSSIKGAPRLVAEVKFPELDPAATRRLRASLAREVARLSARYPGLVDYESRNSAGLELNAALRGTAFTDTDLKAFLLLRSRMLRIDLSGTSITDASAQTLAQMTALKTLRLTNTRTGDVTLSALSEIKSLKSLTVTGTRATKSALAPLAKNGVEVHGDSNAD